MSEKQFADISAYFSAMGKKGGACKSLAKANASRANGLKGGRPRRILADAFYPARTEAFKTDGTRIRAISLFSGAGGLDLGFHRAGVEIVWANDYNKSACETYRANFGGVIHQGSIMDFDYAALPECDLVFGGPPCQGFSVAGKMDPDDPRSKLVFEFQKVVAAKRPKVFVMENVAALANLDKFAGVRDALLKGYRELGYHVRFRVLDSSQFETPQRRERMIMIGTTMAEARIRFPANGGRTITAREALSGLDMPGIGNNQGICHARITVAKHPVLRKSPFAGMLFNGLGRPLDLDRPAQTLPASMGGNKTPIIDERWLAEETAQSWVATYHARLCSSDPAEVAAQTTVPPYLRRLTVSEAACLQGFPNGFVFKGAQSEKFKQIGNSVPPPFAYHIAKSVLESMFWNA